MKLITRDTDYAIRAICYIARNKDRITSVSEAVKILKIPRPFLRKILQILNKKRILKSYRGKGGGFTLNKPADKISLVQLIEAFQGPLRLNECFFKKRVCPNTKKCSLRKKIAKIEHYALRELKTVSIASLLS